MADSRQLDTAVVSSVWRSGSSPLRSAVTLAVGQVRAADMAPALRKLLSDSDTAVAASAAYSLGLLRDSGAVSALAATLGAPSAVAREAAWALGEIGAPAASAVRASLAAGARPNEVLGDLLLASAKLRPVPAETVIPYLQHADSEVRWRAAYAVARPLVPAGLRALLSLVGDTSAAVRAQVARAFSVRAAGDSLRRNALDVLARLVQDPHPHVRINAIRSLSTYGPGARTAVAGAVRDPDANVRITAAQSLGAVMDSSAAPWLILWNADTGFMYRRSLLASAIRSGARLPWHEATAAESWTRSGDWRLRAAVAEAAGSAADEATLLRIAQPLTRDPDGRVRTAAYSSLSPDTSRTSAIQTERRALILSALGDPDFYARATAIAALLPRASAAEVPAVVASYRMALGDSLFDARIAAVRYVAAAWRQDSQAFTDSLRLELTALAIPSEALVRGEGKSVSPLRHWAAETGTARPIVWYEDRVRALVLPALRGRVPRAEIVTERGTIMLDLFALDAPLTVDNFVRLARGGYYDGVRFHRVVPNFVAQDGDPRGDGNGGPPHTIRDELNRRRYTRGAVGMALSGPDTGGSQYFITLSPQPHLDGGYTVFGGVVSGQHVMDALVQGDLIRTIRIR